MMNERYGPTSRRAVLALCLLSLATLPARPARAQDPDPPSPEKRFTTTLDTGALTVLTRGEKREFLAARVTVGAAVLKQLRAFARLDASGSQDGGQLDIEDLSTFRNLELAGGLRYAIKGKLSVAALGGVTYSIEGDRGAPLDPRLFTAALLARLDIGEHGGYVYAGGGHHGPVGGPALLLAASVPLKDRTFAVLDIAFPLERNVMREKTWLIKLGATARVKSIGF